MVTPLCDATEVRILYSPPASWPNGSSVRLRSMVDWVLSWVIPKTLKNGTAASLAKRSAF